MIRPEEKSALKAAMEASARVHREAELALILLNDEMKGGLYTQEEYKAKRHRIMRQAEISEEDLMTRKVYGVGGTDAPGPQNAMTWKDLERHRAGEDRQDAIDSGQVTKRSLEQALKEELSKARVSPKPAPSADFAKQLAELDTLEAQGAITAVQHEVRSHQIRQRKTWTPEQRGRIESELGALLYRWESGGVTDEEYERAKEGVMK